jgi:hypothetical protein
MTPESIPEILWAVERYRRRLAAALDGLDQARRVAAETGIALVAGGGDLAPLLDHFSDDLRASDHRLQSLVAELAHPS